LIQRLESVWLGKKDWEREGSTRKTMAGLRRQHGGCREVVDDEQRSESTGEQLPRREREREGEKRVARWLTAT
jgi:hypothetical protein